MMKTPTHQQQADDNEVQDTLGETADARKSKYKTIVEEL